MFARPIHRPVHRSVGITAEQVALVWSCAAKRRCRLSEEIHGV